MYKFKTKYKSCFTTIDELQYISQGDSPPSPYKYNAHIEKQANYNLFIVSPVSSGKTIPINSYQLTGKGVSTKAKIYNEYDQYKNNYVDGYTVFGKIDKYAKRRLFKKDKVIYDLIF